jgi:P27 family predicted phage terminase small subunit
MGAILGSNNQGGRKFSPVADGNTEHKQKYKKLIKAQKNLAELPDDPPHFLDYYGKKLWKKVVPQLKAMGLVKEIDQSIIEMLCDSYGLYRHAYNDLKKSDLVVKDKKNPLINIMNDEKKVILQCSRELGLTYGSRSAMLPDKSDDEGKENVDTTEILRILGSDNNEKDA